MKIVWFAQKRLLNYKKSHTNHIAVDVMNFSGEERSCLGSVHSVSTVMAMKKLFNSGDESSRKEGGIKVKTDSVQSVDADVKGDDGGEY